MWRRQQVQHVHEGPRISRDSALKALLDDEELSDVKLQGNDGVRVRACRCLLAARSEVFRAKLIRNLNQPKEDVVSFDYRGNVLRSIVQFCFLDKPELFARDKSSFGVQEAREITELIEAANFFLLPELKCRTEDFAHAVMKVSPSMALLLLDQSMQFGPPLALLRDRTMEVIRAKAKTFVAAKELFDINELAIEIILKDTMIEAEEISLFHMLNAWAEASQGQNRKEVSSRRNKAKQLLANIRLEHILASDLEEVVAPSGLASPDQLNNAYKRRALFLDAIAAGPQAKKPRFTPHWPSSNSQILMFTDGDRKVDALLCAPMTYGSHQWRFRVENVVHHLGLGVASPAPSPESEEPREGVVITSQGRMFTQGSDGGGWCEQPSLEAPFPFHNGSVVTFLLDLTTTGILWVAVDDSEFCKMFGNINSLFSHGQVRLVPCVRLGNEGDRVRFLGFKSIDQH